MDKNSLETLLEQGLSLERIGRRFGKHPATVSYWLKKHRLEPRYREKHAGRGGIERTRLEELVERGMSIAELASELQLSKATVRHWLRRYGLRTSRTRRIQAERDAKDIGLSVLILRCPTHGETDFVIDGTGRYRCRRCRVEGVTRRRRKVKALLVPRPVDAAVSAVMTGMWEPSSSTTLIVTRNVSRSIAPERRWHSRRSKRKRASVSFSARIAMPKSRRALPHFPLECLHGQK